MPELTRLHTKQLASVHMRQVLEEHLDPVWGSAYWLERARLAGIRSASEIQDLAMLIEVFQQKTSDLQCRPVLDYVPRQYHRQLHRLIIGQTGGTTGQGTWTAYLDDEFHQAFVKPFAVAATQANFPTGLNWLFANPTGPHIIGKAACAIARSMDSLEPFMIDFDPHWSRKLPAESMGAQRYLQHVIDQAMAVINSQEIGVIFATPPVLRLAQKLADITPGNLPRSFFTASGSEAVEGAMLTSVLHTGKPGIIALDNGLHGRTRWAMNATGLAMWRTDPFPLPDVTHLPLGDLNALEVLLQKHAGHYAALIAEPIQSNGGIIVPPADYWPGVRALCTKHDVLLIFDEIQTGMGRTGKWFASEHWQVTPDIMTISKALGNGFPIAALSSCLHATKPLRLRRVFKAFCASTILYLNLWWWMIAVLTRPRPSLHHSPWMSHV